MDGLGEELDFRDIRGWVGADGLLRLQMPDGEIIRVRGRVTGRDGRDGKTPVKGVDYHDGDRGPPGESIVGPPGPVGARGAGAACGHGLPSPTLDAAFYVDLDTGDVWTR